jgi:hypothetical protein
MELVSGVLTAIVRLAECTHASAGESPEHGDNRRNHHQLLNGKQLYGAYMEVLQERVLPKEKQSRPQ